MPRVGRIPLADGVLGGFAPERGQEVVPSGRSACPGLRAGQVSILQLEFFLLEILFLCWECTHISFVGDAPPSSFSPCAEKKKSAVHGGEEKEGFGSRLIGSRLSSLAAQVVRTLCSLVPSRYAGFLLAALRAGAGLGSCVVRSVFFCCASIA